MSTCADCKYYSEDSEMNARVPDNHPRRELMIRGTCHRFPPPSDHHPRRESQGSIVSSSYWCGEWVAKA